MMVRNPGSDVMREFIFYDEIVFLVFFGLMTARLYISIKKIRARTLGVEGS